MSTPETTPDDAPLTERQIRFACCQLIEWGGFSLAEAHRIYDAEMRRLKERPNA